MPILKEVMMITLVELIFTELTEEVIVVVRVKFSAASLIAFLPYLFNYQPMVHTHVYQHSYA